VTGTVDFDPEGGLAGRSAEVGQLRSAVRQVAGGTGGALVVVGEAGIGKTRVIAEGLIDADGLGVRVFEGAADELEQRRPFGVIADCLASGRSATERGPRWPDCFGRTRAPVSARVGWRTLPRPSSGS
jgi:hypothetical protein